MTEALGNQGQIWELKIKNGEMQLRLRNCLWSPGSSKGVSLGVQLWSSLPSPLCSRAFGLCCQGSRMPQAVAVKWKAGSHWAGPRAKGRHAQICQLLDRLHRNVPTVPSTLTATTRQTAGADSCSRCSIREGAIVGTGKGPGWQLEALTEQARHKQGQGRSPGHDPGHLTSRSLSLRICSMMVGGGSSSEWVPFSWCDLGQVPSLSVPQFVHLSRGLIRVIASGLTIKIE